MSLTDTSIIPDEFERFLCTDEEVDLVFAQEDDLEHHSCYGIRFVSDEGRKIKNIFFSHKDKGNYLYTHEDDYSNFKLQLDSECTKEILSELLMVGFYSYISLHETLLLHASAICYKEKAVVFTAASGVGKTTQAELWKKHRNADILNGDKVFLKKTSDQIVAWGSPWKGSSPYTENTYAQLGAIIVLEQAEENSIRKLSDLEILEKVVPHLFIPNWDTSLENKVFNFLDEVLRNTEVYLLKCKPDEDAVELVESAVFR